MTDLKPTYAEFMAAVDNYRAKRTDLRWGQCHYNVLYDLRPDLANAVRSTAADPFYDDTRIDDFLIYIQVNWNADD